MTITNTNPKLIAILQAIDPKAHVFTQFDWDSFAGCNSEDPWIGSKEEYVIVVDGNTLVFAIDDAEWSFVLIP